MVERSGSESTREWLRGVVERSGREEWLRGVVERSG